LERANIEGQLNCKGAHFENENEGALIGQSAPVKGEVFFTEGCEFNGSLDLSHARIGVMADNRDSWPKPNDLTIDGISIERFGGDAPIDAQARLRWL
jgi:hypothetical protein